MPSAGAATTSWVSPAASIVGRDHLAVQAVSEHLFTEVPTPIVPRLAPLSW
jgi:hypothetical protein